MCQSVYQIMNNQEMAYLELLRQGLSSDKTVYQPLNLDFLCDDKDNEWCPSYLVWAVAFI